MRTFFKCLLLAVVVSGCGLTQRFATYPERPSRSCAQPALFIDIVAFGAAITKLSILPKRYAKTTKEEITNALVVGVATLAGTSALLQMIECE